MEKMDKREHKRTVFSESDQIFGIIKPLRNHGKPFNARVMNISEGGIFLAVDRSTQVLNGDLLTISHLKGSSQLKGFVNVRMEIKWVVRDPMLTYIGVGCAFCDIKENLQTQIRELAKTVSMA